MEITKHKNGDLMEAVVTGRLDAYWADHLLGQMDEMIRDGSIHIRLNLHAVDYVSSAGIRVLLKYYKQLKSIQGSFFITHPSAPVRDILEMAGFADLLLNVPEAVAKESGRSPAGDSEAKNDRRSIGNASWETIALDPKTSLRCRTLGDPALLEGCRFREEDCRALPCNEQIMAVGLGALGSGFNDCRGRFGEFLSVAGVAAYLPTDGTGAADCQMASGDYVPDVQAMYALTCEGDFSHLLRFETTAEGGAIGLSDLVSACFTISGADRLGIVILAEAAGLMGAALRKSPAEISSSGASSAPYGFPDAREWLSFSAERAFPHSLAVVAGVVSQRDDAALAPLVRPIGPAPFPIGHMHAASFAYRPVQRGRIEMKSAVRSLFETESLQGILHLLCDPREISGGGESEFIRGACWIAPISSVEKG